MWVVYSETGEQVSSVHSSKAAEKQGKWLPCIDGELLSRCGKEPQTDLEDEWRAELVSMTHEKFVKFVSWLWSDSNERD